MKKTLLLLTIIVSAIAFQQCLREDLSIIENRVVIENDNWQLVGDLVIPGTNKPVPAVLLLNQAAGDRTVYKNLANHLAIRGIASLRLDLRGHGESINAGQFNPADRETIKFIWEAEQDIVFALEYLSSNSAIDANKIGVVGASYSGEEMAEAARNQNYMKMYAALSPGSFSEASINAIDSSAVSWLFITSKEDQFLQNITAAVQEKSDSVELLIIPGETHGTDILEARPDIAERISLWFAAGMK